MANIDNRKIYISYSKGENIETGKIDYTEPQEMFASVGERTSYETIQNIGRIPEYDRSLVIDYGDKSEFVSEDSVLWIDNEPNEDKDNYDYVIARVGDIIHGQIKVYCNAVSPNTQFLYYSNDNENIYQVKVFFNGLNVIVPRTMYLPINADSLVWNKKPSSIESKENQIKFINKDIQNKAYIYKFEVVDGN